MRVTRGRQPDVTGLLQELERIARQLELARSETQRLASVRDRIIRALRREGATAGELARAARLSAGRVTQICDGEVF